MRRTLTAVVPTEETEKAGAKRLSSSEARARIERFEVATRAEFDAQVARRQLVLAPLQPLPRTQP